MVLLYGIPNCDSVKKARTWLNEHHIDIEFHNFKQTPPTIQQIKAWLNDIPLSTLLNKKGTTWRQLTPEQKAKAETTTDAIQLIHDYPNLIKRPILIHNHKAYCGFQAAFYEEIFQQNKELNG